MSRYENVRAVAEAYLKEKGHLPAPSTLRTHVARKCGNWPSLALAKRVVADLGYTPHTDPAIPNLNGTPLSIPATPWQQRDWSDYPQLQPPILILSDLHIPYHDPRWIEQACREALGRGVRRLLIAGDLIDAKNIAKWSAERSHRLEDELDVARRVIAALTGAFETHIILGNHDDRIAKKLDRELSTHRVLEWLLGDGVRIYRHHQAFVGQGWLVAHPGNYSRMPGKPALELSAKYSRHVAIAHTHKWTATRDASGGRWIIELGGCFNPRSMDYIHRELRTFPYPQQGALILTRAEQPVLLHPELG